MKNYEPRRCEICGKEYVPKRSDQRCCLAPECKKERHKLNYIEYRAKHYARVLESNRRCMAKKRKERKQQEHTTKADTIVAIGYADRQREQTLKMVGRVKVEL